MNLPFPSFPSVIYLYFICSSVCFRDTVYINHNHSVNSMRPWRKLWALHHGDTTDYKEYSLFSDFYFGRGKNIKRLSLMYLSLSPHLNLHFHLRAHADFTDEINEASQLPLSIHQVQLQRTSGRSSWFILYTLHLLHSSVWERCVASSTPATTYQTPRMFHQPFHSSLFFSD